MASYYVNQNAQPKSGDHEVHRQGCYWLSLVAHKHYLGDFATCGPAVAKAKKIYRKANGCGHCSPACHTG